MAGLSSLCVCVCLVCACVFSVCVPDKCLLNYAQRNAPTPPRGHRPTLFASRRCVCVCTLKLVVVVDVVAALELK